MSPELRHLRYLLAVAEHGNFTRAAAELHLSQPTLSQQIRRLERLVGTPLLDRSGRAVRLTDAGSVYARHARRALRELDQAEQAVHDVADLTRGHLRLAVTPTFTSYLVGPLVAELRARHPGITLELTETSQDALESRLLADELDLGIAFVRSHFGGIAATPLATETLSLVRAADGTVRPAPISPADLAEYELALLNSDFATRGHIDDYFRAHAVIPRIAVEANSIEAVIEIVQHTTLATVLPDAVSADRAGLTAVALDPPLPARTAALLRRENAYASAAARAFTRIIESWPGPGVPA